jgi:Methyltransferase domain
MKGTVDREPSTTLPDPVEATAQNPTIQAAVRALIDGEVPWTLNRRCPYESDPAQWGHSLINDVELITACLDGSGARSVVEVGAYAGDLTRLLLDWAEGSGARVWAIDPEPQPELLQLDEARPDLELIRATSLEALQSVPLPDAVVIDGDHNYYTVREELRLLGQKASEGELPLLLFHDVCWPHARRDSYYAPERIPEEHRQPVVTGAHLVPGDPGTRLGGLPYKFAAAREGGPCNGVLTAVEDFVAEGEGLHLALVPAFFGVGVVWHRDARWATAVAEVLEPLDRHPVLERLEANRVFHLASHHQQMAHAAMAQQRLARQEAVLRRLLESSAFSVAERLSRVRERLGIGRQAAVVSKDEVRRALSD